MSHEKKMKNLLDRLVSMSPEPPPYPEEVPMARPDPKRTFNPVLVFAGAVAVVALLAVPLIMWTGSGPEVAGSTTLAPVTTTIHEAEPSTTVTDQSTTTLDDQVGAGSWAGPVFLYQTPENSFLSNPALVPVVMEVFAAVDVGDEFSWALSAMSESGASLPQGLENSIPEGVIVENISEELDGDSRTFIVDMSPEFLDGAGGLLADVTMLNQIIYTLTESYPEASILFTVGGDPVEAYGSEGIVLTDPVDRETFRDDLAVIFLTEPIIEVEEVYIVAGLANTFEGSLMVRVIDGAGNTVHEEPVQATCGTGCWGEFGVGVDSDLIVRGESSIQLFTNSPEDGSMTNVLTLPVPLDDLRTTTLD